VLGIGREHSEWPQVTDPALNRIEAIGDSVDSASAACARGSTRAVRVLLMRPPY
jgi:hypothetical protein